MKNILSLLLVFTLLLQTFSKAWVLVSFKINQDYIAKNLCENKSKPMLHCDGKCVLAQKIKQAEKDEQNSEKSPVQSLKKIQEMSVFVVNELTENTFDFFAFIFKKLPKAVQQINYTFHYLNTCFQPPEL